MDMTPQEKAGIVRGLRARRWGNVASLNLEIFVGDCLEIKVGGDAAQSYVLPSGAQEITYTSLSKIFETSNRAFVRFSRNLLDLISSIEKDILKRKQLAYASSAVKTYLFHDEILSFCQGDAVRAHYRTLGRRRSEILGAYRDFSEDLRDFPAVIFENQEYDAPKELFILARKMLFDASRKYQGNLLEVNNMRPLTIGFKKGNDLLFDPLAVYYSEDDVSKAFKLQLQKYAGEQK